MPKTQVSVVKERHLHPKFPRLRLELRSDSKFFQAVTRLDNKLRQKTTGTDNLVTAYRVAEDWYRREVKASQLAARQHPVDVITKDPTMAELFASYKLTLETEAKQKYADQKWDPIAGFWRAIRLSTVGPKTFRDFYIWRRKNFRKFVHTGNGKEHKLTNNTIHKDKILIRQVLKHAVHEELIERLPAIPSQGKIDSNPRPWLDEHEWHKLSATARKRLREAQMDFKRNRNKASARLLQHRQDMDDLIRFLYESMFRVNELQKNLKFKDCIVETNDSGDEMLSCRLRRGKVGGRPVITTRGAVEVYRRRLKEAGGDVSAFIFPRRHKDGFASLLEAAGLRFNEEGFVRNLKSMRASSISGTLLRNPDANLWAVSRNAGVGINTIDKFYAKRLTALMAKNQLSKNPPVNPFDPLDKLRDQVLREGLDVGDDHMGEDAPETGGEPWHQAKRDLKVLKQPKP